MEIKKLTRNNFFYSLMHKTLAILMLLSISGCYQDMCIEADDFGAPNVTVPVFTNSSAIGGVEDSEFVPWIDSGYILDGSNLVLVVKNWTYGKQSNSADQLSAWSPWYANFDKDKGLLPTMVQRFPDCQFTSSQGVSNYKVANPPCLMKQGKGLYAAIASKFYDINGSDSSKQFPDTSSAVALHLGETLSTPLQDVDNDGNLIPAGGLIFDFNNSENTTAKGFLQDGAKLYFKILDSYYGDNSGQYIVKIKSGVQTSSSDPITTIVSLVKGVLFGVTPSSDAGYFDRSSIDKKGVIFSIFDNIVSVPSFKNTVKLLLTLYIAFLGIGFTVGLIQINANDLMKRYFKICLLSILISENSWQFFYDYFFTFFIDGSQQIINLIQKAGNTGPGSNNIITLMLAPQTLIKLFSLLFVSWDGFIYIILYFICFCFLFVTIFKAYLVYLNALILMGIVIATGPIFLCFMLFKATEAFFKNWMQQLVSYSLQPVILFTGITFMSMIVRHQIYTTLGFKVCKVEFPKLSNDIQKAMTISDSFFKSSIFYWWIPKPDGIPQGTTLTNVLVPEAHFQTTPGSDKPASNEICKGNPSYNNGAYAVNTDASKSTYCQAYGCTEKRVAEFPFLDPNIPQDCDRLNFIYQNNSLRQNYWNILFLAVLIWLISKFNEVAVGIANTISGALNFGRAPTVDTQGAAERAYAGIKSEISNSAPANYARNAVRGLVQSTYDKTIGAGVAAVKDRYEQFKENQYPKKIQAAATADLKKLQDISGKMESFKQLGDGLKGKFADSFKDIKGKDGKALDGQGLIDALSKKSSMRNTEAGVKMKGGLRTLLTGKRDTKLMHNEAALAVYGKKFTQLSEEQKARVKGFVSDNAKEINQLRQMKKYSSAKKAFAKESQALKDMYASGKDYSKIELNSDKNLDAALKSLVKEARLDLLKPKADSKDSLKQQKSEELYKSNLLSDSNGSLDNVRAKLKDNLTSSKEKLLDDLARSVTSDVNASYGKLSAADAKKVDAEFKLQFGENNGDRLKYQLAQIKYGDYYDKLDGDRKRVIDSLLDKEGRAALDGKSFVDKIGEAQKLREFQEDYAKRYREIEKTKVEAKSPIEPKNMSEYVSGDERFRTKKEQLVEDKLKLESKELQKRIDALEADQSSMFGRLKGLDKNKNYAEILELEKQKLNYSIHSDLSKDKIILGSRYMSEDMTREIAQEKLQQLDAKYKATLQQDKYLKDSKKYLDELQKLSGKRESYEALDVGEKAAPKGIREEREKTEQEFKRISDLVNFNEDRKRQIDEVFGQYRDKLAAKVDGDLDGKSSIPKPARNKVDGDLDGKSSISKPAGNKVDGDLDGKSSIPKPAGNKDDVKFAGSVDRMLNPQFLDQDLIESRFGDFVPSGTKAAYDQNTPELLEREGKEKEGPSERDADEYRVRKNSVQSDLSQVLTEATLLNVTPPTAEGAVEELVKVTDKIRKQQDFIEGIESAVEASYAASNLAQDEPESLSPKISTILDDDTKPAAPVRLNDEVRLRRIVKTPPDALPPKGSSKESSPQNGGDDSE